MILELKEANKKHLFLPREWVYHVLSLPEGKYEIVKAKRTSEQNRRYWGKIIEAFADYTGYSKDEVHQILAKKFLSYEKKGKSGKVHTFVKSTTELNTKEFAFYNDQCELFGIEYGIKFL